MARDRRLTIVVKAAVVGSANTWAAQVDTGGQGDRTFTVALSPTGLPPATHYWCGWQMDPTDDSGMRTRLAAAVAAGNAFVYDGLTVDPQTVLAGLGLQRVVG